MKIRKYQQDDERTILTGMIVNARVLGRIFSHIKSERKPFRSKWGNLVAGWCLSYYEKYQKAPRAALVVLFRDFADKSKDEEVVGIVETFLSSLSDDYAGLSKELNEDHLIDVAARYFNQVKMEKLNQSIEADLLKKDLESAHTHISSFTPINLATSSMVDVLTDEEVWKDAIQPEEVDVLIQYPGALGEFFGPHLQREGFVAFLAPEKRGKSFWLIDMAWRSSILNKKKTLLYSVGDMSQRQMMKRLITRALKRPIHSAAVDCPTSIRKRRGEEAEVEVESIEFNDSVSMALVKKAIKKIEMKTAHKTSLLKMKCTPISSTRVVDIRTDIEELIRSGWVPDVVVIDYADILAPEPGSKETDFRHQVNETWKALRKLSQDFHVLVVTATQSNTNSYNRDTLRRDNFSEDKRKLSHITGMLGINQTEEEKDKGIFRLNWIALREGSYFESKCVTVAGSLALANPAIVSTW